MFLSHLKIILVPPHSPSENGDKDIWPPIDVNISFPDDYVDFTKSYGTGRIADFIALFNPFTKNDDLDFFEQKKPILEDFNYLIDEDSDYYNYTLYPNKGGLLPVGVTDNGDYFFWVVSNVENSNLWGTAIVASRSPDVEYFDMNITSLLAGILSKKIKPDSLPGNFPYKQVTFDQI